VADRIDPYYDYGYTSGVGKTMPYDSNPGAWFYRGPVDPSVSINLVGGNIQECSETNGANVAFEATVNVDESDPDQSIEWKVNSTYVAEGSSVNIFVPLGVDNTVDVYMMTVSGDSATATTEVTIEDTVAPSISAAFIDRKSGIELSQTQSKSKVLATYEVEDACDPAPAITATTGVAFNSGDAIMPVVSKKSGETSVTIEGSASSELQMTVGAEDASGNVSEETRSITVVK
jgi:hypothetical protein